MCGSRWLGVPPPCPIDDTPYTACTADTVAALRARGLALPPGTVLAVTVERPPSLPAPAAAAAAQPSHVVGPSVTTKTYRGKHPKPLRTGA